MELFSNFYLIILFPLFLAIFWFGLKQSSSGKNESRRDAILKEDKKSEKGPSVSTQFLKFLTSLCGFFFMNAFPIVKDIRVFFERKKINKYPYYLYSILSLSFINILLFFYYSDILFLLYSIAIVIAFIFIPAFIVGKLQERYRDRFLRLFSQALQHIISSLSIGTPLDACILAASHQVDEPISSEFALISHKLTLGVPLAQALEEMGHNINVEECWLFVLALKFQEKSGGSLVVILEKLLHLLKERYRVEREIRYLSSGGKTSALVIVIVPLLLSSILLITNKNYAHFFFKDETGTFLLITSLILISIGIFVVWNISNSVTK